MIPQVFPEGPLPPSSFFATALALAETMVDCDPSAFVTIEVTVTIICETVATVECSTQQEERVESVRGRT